MRVVLVEPIYDMNVGKVCRVMKNFGFSDLYIVKPKARLGLDAVKYAKYASDVLKNARLVNSFEEATKGCFPIIGTTASFIKGERGLSEPQPLSEVKGKYNLEKAAIVFGREDRGLSKEELLKCDLNVYIETSGEYPSLNLSNAAAIVLYELRVQDKVRTRVRKMADVKTVRMLTKYFDSIVDNVKNSLRNPSKCKKAFRNIVSRSNPEEVEVNSVMCVLKEVNLALKKCSVE